MLFDEFAVAYRRGEAPDVLEYLERAGDDADALASLVDRFLEAVPARETSEEEIVLMQARHEAEPPILALRRRRALTREVVVEALVRALGLDQGKGEKVERYYHELETGLLDPEPVDASVWAALADTLRANVRALAVFRPPPLTAPVAMREASGDWVLAEQVAVEPLPAAPQPPDEVDRLFTGRPES